MPVRYNALNCADAFGQGDGMQYDLVTAADYDGFPEEKDLKFIALEETCRRNMNDMLSGDNPEHFDRLVKLQYMSTIKAAADELGISGISVNLNVVRAYEAFDRFMLDVIGTITQLRLRNRREGDPNSVRLSVRNRALIGRELDRLQAAIEKSDLPAQKREALLKKLDELRAEIDKSRVGFGKALAVMAFIMAGTATTTSFLADAPNAIATITKLLGIDKAAEDAERERLGGPAGPRALPAPSQANSAVPSRSSPPDDDEIPF